MHAVMNPTLIAPRRAAPLASLSGSPVSAGGKPRRIAAKEQIFARGDRAAQFFLILDGLVKVTASSSEGKEIILAILGPGELIGEIASMQGTEHSASVVAIEPTDILAFERQEFLDLIHKDHEFALSLLKTVCSRLKGASELAEDLSFLPLPVRLAKRLISLAHTYGIMSPRGMRIGLHLCQQELANMVGTSRESVNKQLALWQGKGLISTRKGYLTIRHIPTFAAQYHLLAPALSVQ
jgi:CRP-like cAMP-binding protein